MAKQDRSSTSSKTKQSTPPTAVVAQVGGSHYDRKAAICPHCGEAIQHWDLMASEPYLEGYASKYLMRWREKGGIQDLDKAISIIEKIKAIERVRNATEK